MQIGLIGCGNMASALARGWGRPMLCADPVTERARSLAAEVGGEALVAEAQVDAGVRHGIPAAHGAELVVQTLAGTAELLRRRGYDTLEVRREVASPGGLTARGLAALEQGGLRAAFSDALDAVLEDSSA